jgi:hypothetical protein
MINYSIKHFKAIEIITKIKKYMKILMCMKKIRFLNLITIVEF